MSIKPPYSPLSLESALLGQERYWREDRKTWRREKKGADGSTRISRPRTPAEDRDLRHHYANLLARIATHGQAATEQANRLDECTVRQPCGNAACPACLGAFQHGLVSAITKFMKSVDPKHGNIFAVSLVPADEMVQASGLATLDLVNFHRGIRERLQAIVPHCAWLMLGIDLSLNQDAQNRWKPKWSPHLYGFLQTRISSSQLRIQLKQLFPADPPIVRRPVKVKEFTPTRYGTSYFLKPDFKRRITYAHSKGERSKYAPLRSGQRAELQQVLRWLDRTSISDRLLLIGVRTVRSKKDLKFVVLDSVKTRRAPYRHVCSKPGE